MPEADPDKIRYFAQAGELGAWLRENHDSETELWVQMYKKKSGVPSPQWQELVLELLCWGWIDGLRKSYDEKSFIQRISPRRARSVWSEVNVANVERLIKEGRMQEPGMAQVLAAKADGRWQKAYTASKLELPEDFLSAAQAHPEGQSRIRALSKTQRTNIALTLFSLKRQETRQRRIAELLAELGISADR